MTGWKSTAGQQSQGFIKALQSFSKTASVLVFLIGVVVILGWMLQLDCLKTVVPGSVSMKMNTALGFVFGGTALWLWHQHPSAHQARFFGQSCALIVFLLGFLTLIEYSCSLDLGIDQIWVKTPLEPLSDVAPGRMAVPTALNFCLLGFALLLLNTRRAKALPVQLLASVICLIASSGLLGYLFGNAVFYRIGSATSMAVHTSLAFLLLSLGILFARPQYGITAIFIQLDAGGVLARRLIPSVIIIPPLVCWLLLLGVRSHLYTPELGICLLSLLIAIVFTLIISTNARSLSRSEQQQRRAEAALQQANDALEQRVAERTSQLQQTNEHLQTEIVERQQAELAIQQLNTELEQRVADRTVELTQMNERFQAFMNYSPASTWITDAEGQVLYVNQTYLRTFQLSTTAVVGKSVLELYEAEVAQLFLDSIRTVVETQQVLEIIEVAPHCNGAPGEFLVYRFPIPGPLEQTWVGGVALDVTERRALEREVLQKQRILEDFITCSPVGMTFLDHELRYVVINEALASVNGVPITAHIGKTPWEIVPDVAANLEEVFQQVLTTGEPVLSIEVSGETPKTPGSKQDWLASYFPIRSEAHQSFGLGIVAVDITARKRAERENQLLKERLQFVLSSNPAVIFACQPSGNYDATFISSNTQSILGFPPEDFLANASFWINRIHPDDAPQLFEALPRLFTQRHHVQEYRFRHQDGSYRWLQHELQLVQDSQGVPLEIVGYLADISDRKQAEQQLELQDTIVKNMAEGICLVKEADRSIVYTNPKFEQMFGYEPGDLIGQDVSVLNYKGETSDAAATTQVILSNINTYGVHSYEIYNVKRDGTPFWCRATTSRFEHPEYGVVYVAVQADISDLKRAEAAARASLQIKADLVAKEASLREKEVLLQEIHHRVKNNLQIVDGLLQMQSRRTDNPQAAAILRESQHRIKSIALVHEKLYRSDDLARIDFSEYIRSLVASLFASYQLGSTSVTPRFKVEALTLEIDLAIPCGLIINELVSNALKYAFPDEALPCNETVHNGEIQIEFSAHDETWLTLSVSDNGIGMPEHIDLTKTPSLGLKLVRSLATQLEGTVAIKREQGTLIKVTFPGRSLN